jgi:integrase
MLRLQLLLGARVGEIAGMARHEFDMEARTWTTPAKRTKNKRQHILPLSPLARKLIAERMMEQPGRFLFPTKHGNSQDSEHIAQGLQAALPHFEFRTRDTEPAPITSHDLRRTLATKLRELGFSSDVRDAVLNHITAKQRSVTEAHYTHADLSAEMHEALSTWEGAIGDIINGGDPFAKSATEMDDIEARALARFDRNKVVPLRRVS